MGFQVIAIVYLLLSAFNFAAAKSMWFDVAIRSRSGVKKTTLKKFSTVYLLEKKPVPGHANRFLIFGKLVTTDSEDTVIYRNLWFPFDTKAPKAKLFKNEPPKDMLAIPTTDLGKAVYGFPIIDLPAYIDNRKWRQLKRKYKKEKRNWRKHLFLGLEKYVPISNLNVSKAATDDRQACPQHPQRKNGKPCIPMQTPHKISQPIKNIIREAAKKHGVDPALIASIIHAETQFNPFSENKHEKRQCTKEKKCSKYRWGKGFAQLGASDAHKYGVDWHTEIPRPKSCRRHFRSSRCTKDLLKVCRHYIRKNKHKKNNRRLEPVNCPRASILAIAQKIKSIIPTKMPVWIINRKGQLVEKDLVPHFLSSEAELIRSHSSAYNRRIARIANSYIEFFERHSRFPRDYGEAWAVPRGKSTPVRELMGYSILNGQYINRCYIWNIAGLCGKIPKNSLTGQYRKIFGHWPANQNTVQKYQYLLKANKDKDATEPSDAQTR